MAKMPRWIQISLLVIVLAGLAWLLRPAPVTVETGVVERRDYFEAIEAQGRTRARNPYVITAPVAGRLLRPGLDEGDRIEAGQIVAVIAPSPQDQRSTAYAEASLTAAEARLNSAEASLQETRSAYQRIERERERREQLFSSGLSSEEEIGLYRQMEAAELARVQSAEAAVAAARADIESTRALLLGADSNSNEGRIEVRAPVAGTVYRVMESNERVVQAGTPLMETSNQDSLEVVIDLLTQEAVQVAAGDTVYLAGWGGDQTISAMVRQVEPQAFTKISALGVEEQRVNVIADLFQRPEELGAEYRVEAAIVTWQGQDVLTIPTSAIFQSPAGWHCYVVSNGRAILTPLTIGPRGRDFTRVIAGVEEEDSVILYPSDLVRDGVAVVRE